MKKSTLGEYHTVRPTRTQKLFETSKIEILENERPMKHIPS